MTFHWELIIQAFAAVASLSVAGAAVWIAFRSTRAQEKSAEISETLLRLEETREIQDLARFRLLMRTTPFNDHAILKQGAKTRLRFKLENSGNRGSDIRRLDIELEEESGKKHKPAVKLRRADSGFDSDDLFIEAGRVAKIDAFIKPDGPGSGIRLSACRIQVRVVPVRGEQARSLWTPTIGSPKWVKTI